MGLGAFVWEVCVLERAREGVVGLVRDVSLLVLGWEWKDWG